MSNADRYPLRTMAVEQLDDPEIVADDPSTGAQLVEYTESRGHLNARLDIHGPPSRKTTLVGPNGHILTPATLADFRAYVASRVGAS